MRKDALKEISTRVITEPSSETDVFQCSVEIIVGPDARL
jgi:hypothetical protein